MWVFYQDFEKYFSGKISPQGGPRKLERKEHFIFWGTKLAYVSIYILIPILAVGFVPFIIGFATTSFVCGLFISVVFQMAHMVEATQFPEPNESSNKIEREWAIHQVETTANFATRSKIVSWLLGGLNFQVEHHLFPRISHVHYPKINILVKETCAEYNVNYSEYATVAKAFRSHLVHIKRMGSL
jgi:linoleoyl-CoA desaturase